MSKNTEFNDPVALEMSLKHSYMLLESVGMAPAALPPGHSDRILPEVSPVAPVAPTPAIVPIDPAAPVDESAAVIDNDPLVNGLLKKAVVTNVPKLRSDIEAVYRQVASAFHLKDEAELAGMLDGKEDAKIVLSKLEHIALAIEELSDAANRLK